MYARKVFMQLKPNSVAQLTERVDREIIPLLRKQKGFLDEITFIGHDGANAFGISLWDNKENAEAYNGAPYAEVTKLLSKMVEGTPKVETFEVANSTFHKIAAAVAAKV